MYLERHIRKNPGVVIQSSSNAVKAIKEEMDLARKDFGNPEGTKQYKFWIVEEFPRFLRVNDPRGLKITGIRQIHSLSLSPEGIIAQKLSCQHCPLISYCEDCTALKPLISSEQIRGINADYESDSENSGDEEAFEEEVDRDDGNSGSDVDEVRTDKDSETESDKEEDPEPGDVVWALWYRKWRAGIVLALSQVPDNLRKQLITKNTQYLILKFYGNQKITRIHKSKIEPLGEHLIDKHRAIDDPASYNDALADQIYDSCI